MSIQQINHYGLYFYAPMALDSVRKAKVTLNPFVKNIQGEKWLQDLENLATFYRGLVDKMMQEIAETSQAIRKMNAEAEKVTTWRNAIYYFALNAPEHERALMLKAAGRGLGRVESPKQAKAFLAKVQALIEPLADKFTALGADPELIAFPKNHLATLENMSSEVRDEKADDSILRSDLNHQRALLVEKLNSIEKAAKAAAMQQDLLHPDAENPAQRMVQDLEKSLSQALVNAHAKAADPKVPAALTSDDVVSHDDDPIGTTPLGE